MPIQLLNTNNTGTFTLVNKSNGGSMSFDVYAPPSPTPSVSVTPSITISTTPSVSITPSITVSTTPSVSVTPSITVSTTPSITVTPSISISATPSISVTPSISITPTPTITPSTTPPYSVTRQYSPLTTMENPGSGNLRTNNASISSVTEVAVSIGSASASALSSTTGRTVRLQNSNNTSYLTLQLTSDSTNNGFWILYSGTNTSRAGSFSVGANVTVIIL